MKGLITVDISFFEQLRDLRKLQKNAAYLSQRHGRLPGHLQTRMDEKEKNIDMHLQNILSEKPP